MLRWFREHGSYYWKSLAVFLTAATLPLLAVGLIYYFVGSAQIQAELNRIHTYQLGQAYEDLDAQFTHLESSLAEWVFNPLFSRDLTTIDFGKRFDLYNDINAALRMLESSSALISEAVFFLDSPQTPRTFSQQNGSQPLSPAELGYYQSLLLPQQSSYWVTKPQLEFVTKIPGLSEKPFGALILKINPKALEKIIRRFNTDETGIALITTSSGETISSAGDQFAAMPQLEKTLLELLPGIDASGGAYSFPKGTDVYVVNYKTLSRNDWRLFIASSVSRSMNLVYFMTSLILGSCLFLFLLMVGVSLFASGHVYKPVKNLLRLLQMNGPAPGASPPQDELGYITDRWNILSRENVTLNQRLEQNNDLLKKSFLMQLQQGHLGYMAENEIEEQWAQYWWPLADRAFVVLAVRVLLEEGGQASRRREWEHLLAFDISNKIEVLFRSLSRDGAVLSYPDLTFSILLPVDRQEKERSPLRELSTRIMDEIQTQFGLQSIVVISSVGTHLGDFSRLADDARHALRYRDLHGGLQLIDLQQVQPVGDSKVQYPQTQERNIVEALRMGQLPEAVAALRVFITKLESLSAMEAVFNQQLMQLLSSLLQIIYKSGLNPNHLTPGVDFYSELAELHFKPEIVGWFETRLFQPFVEALSQVRTTQEEQTIDKVAAILEQEFTTPLSLESCADRVGMSPYNLSIKFKQYRGLNFVDYLTNVRIERAKNLLLKSSLSVSAVAEACGYQYNYFMRVFKKAVGTTPGEFRETHLATPKD